VLWLSLLPHVSPCSRVGLVSVNWLLKIKRHEVSMAFSYIRSISNLMKTVAAMTFQEGREHHGSLRKPVFTPAKRKGDWHRGFTDENEQGSYGASETNSGGQSALRRERKVWADEQGFRLGCGWVVRRRGRRSSRDGKLGNIKNILNGNACNKFGIV
jgi:hypothetical protein